MPQGKPAGVRCMQLDDADRCRLFGRAERPRVCASLQPTATMCKATAGQAMAGLARLEVQTTPAPRR